MKGKKYVNLGVQKGIEVFFPKDWNIKVNILGQPVKFTESDALKISDRRFHIMKLRGHTYVVSGEKIEEIFDDNFIKRLKKTGLSIKKVLLAQA